MSWKILEHPEPGTALVEFADGSRLNIGYGQVIDYHDPDQKRPPPVTADEGLSVMPVATLYQFQKGAVLSEHRHDATSLHDIEVLEGRVLVRREKSGDVELGKGDVAEVAEGEMHSIKALEPSTTLHTLLNSMGKKREG